MAFALAQEHVKAAAEAGTDSGAAVGGHVAAANSDNNTALATAPAGATASPFTATMAAAAGVAAATSGLWERHAGSNSSPNAPRHEPAIAATRGPAAGSGAAVALPPVPAAEEPRLQQQLLRAGYAERHAFVARLGSEESHQSQASVESGGHRGGAAATQRATEAFAQLQLTAAAGSHPGAACPATLLREVVQPGAWDGAAGAGGGTSPAGRVTDRRDAPPDHEAGGGAAAERGGVASVHQMVRPLDTTAASETPVPARQATGAAALPHNHAAARRYTQQAQHATAAALASGVLVAFPAGSGPAVARGGAHGGGSYAAVQLDLLSAGTAGTTVASCGSQQLGNTGGWAAASSCSAASTATLSCGGLHVALPDGVDTGSMLLLPHGSTGLSGQQQAAMGASGSGWGGAAGGGHGSGQWTHMQVPPHQLPSGSIGAVAGSATTAAAGLTAATASYYGMRAAAGAPAASVPPLPTSVAGADVASGAVGRSGGGGNAGASVIAEMEALDAVLAQYIDPGAADAPEIAAYLDVMEVDLFPRGLMEAAILGVLDGGNGNGGGGGAGVGAGAGGATAAASPAAPATAAGSGSMATAAPAAAAAAAVAATAPLGAPQHHRRLQLLQPQPYLQVGGAVGAAALPVASAGLAGYTAPGAQQAHAGGSADLTFTQAGPLPRPNVVARPVSQPSAPVLLQQLQTHQQPHWNQQQQPHQPAVSQQAQHQHQHQHQLLQQSSHNQQQQQAPPLRPPAPVAAAGSASPWDQLLATAGGIHVVDCCNASSHSQPGLAAGNAAAAPASAPEQGFVACATPAAHAGASSLVLNRSHSRTQFHDAYEQLAVARRTRAVTSVGTGGLSTLRAGSSGGVVGFVASPRLADRLQAFGLGSRPSSAVLQPRHQAAAGGGGGGTSAMALAPGEGGGVLDGVLGLCGSLRLPALTDAATTLGLGEEDLQDVFRGF
ncbi:hypothetical protein HXX76_007948 [Chlamydomonas incerta]|uniref:Uncharacterized protein n=1 Tax=Chlamydomonas incerta TaxID=51695 RepID=A0A835SZA9_CHLIN|nr:hypothetical protein HXX76_007948 [Chlamydomonas incerta]|eukprot:KAG2434222.1 hypothetical protein HXX76_007948 [Chlamydomonas incerta]